MLNTLESACLQAYRSQEPQAATSADEISRWVAFGLSTLLDTGRLVREKRTSSASEQVAYKGDGSPTTQLESNIESLLRERLAKFEPGAVVVGEETGGVLSTSGLSVAIDPVDGTWAFLSGTETYATTFTVFLDGEAILGMVSNPTTGEIGYATRDGGARLLRLSMFGEPDDACDLPARGVDPGVILVNVHPSRTGERIIRALYEQWRERSVRMVRSPGGSPAWALLEAARGNFTYLNLWSKRPAEPFDLTPGVMLVRAAKGQVTDLEGEPIDMLRHAGPFVAGVDARARRLVAAIAHGVLAR